MKKITCFIFLFSTFAYSDCNIETYSKIIKINNKLDQSIIKNSNCSQKINDTFMDFIDSASGTLSANYLQRYFKNEHQVSFSISPEKIQVNSINEHLDDFFNNDSLLIKKVTSLHNTASFNLTEQDEITFDCSNCNSTGEKNVSAYLNKTKIWLNVLIHVKRKAYQLVKNISDLSEKIDASFFKEILITDTGNIPLLESIEHIQYYQPTKILRRGDIIKKFDLRSRIVIRHGNKVKVIIKKPSINVETMAIANQNGKIGETIELFNEKTRKRFTANVIDFNKVEVNL